MTKHQAAPKRKSQKKASNRIVIGFMVASLWALVCIAAAVVIGLTRSISPAAEVSPNATTAVAQASATFHPTLGSKRPGLAQFENSLFCRKYGCVSPDTSISDANYHPYFIKSYPKYNEFFIEITTQADQISSAGITLDPKPITINELELIETFLASVQPSPVDSTVMTFVESNLGNPINQICDANSTVIGNTQVWVGNIGLAPTVLAAKECVR